MHTSIKLYNKNRDRDVMLVELYRRLVGVITTRINLALSGDSQYNYMSVVGSLCVCVCVCVCV